MTNKMPNSKMAETHFSIDRNQRCNAKIQSNTDARTGRALTTILY